MRLEYICSQCGSAIDHLEVEKLDESALGFDKLNESERQELLSFDPAHNTLTVKSLCDQCIEDMKIEPQKSIPTTYWVH